MRHSILLYVGSQISGCELGAGNQAGAYHDNFAVGAV